MKQPPNWDALPNFQRHEFDSPDVVGSGDLMDRDFMQRLQQARTAAGVPFTITSGYRTAEHHEHLRRLGYKTGRRSAHLLGLAADIACSDSHHRAIIVGALMAAGFTRLGLAGSFIHVDADDARKVSPAIWLYA